jgi:hypothetical protein
MGFVHEPTQDMGPFHVETRRESFYLRKGSGSVVSDDGILVYLNRYPTVSEAGYDAIEKAVRDLVASEQRGDPPVVQNAWRVRARAACDGAVTVVKTGSVEFLYEDIPAIRAAFAQAELRLRGGPGPELVPEARA